MKKLVLMFLMAALLIAFAACSNEEPVLVKNENGLSSQKVPENSIAEKEEPVPEETFDFSEISGKVARSDEICFETENIPWEYAFEQTEHFDRWKKLLFSPEIAEIKAADGHDAVKLGELSQKDVKDIFTFLGGFEPGTFDEKSELNPHTGGAIHFGAYDKNGNSLWTASFNGGWLIIRLEDDEECIIYDVDKQNVEWPSFEFLKTEPIAENNDSAFDNLCEIYYNETGEYSFDMTNVDAGIDPAMFTQIYQTVYDYSDFVGYQMFKTEIENGKTFMELTEPTENYYIAFYEDGEECAALFALSEGEYRFVMAIKGNGLKCFALPEAEEVISLAKELDLSKTECKHVRIIGYMDGILINDGEKEYFYVLGVGTYALGNFFEGELLTTAELAERMFG